MRKISIRDRIENLAFAMLYIVVFPFLWVQEKWSTFFYGKRRMEKEIELLNALLKWTERERDIYRTQAQGYDFIQSENARLKRIIQAKGYTTKKLKNKHSSINQKNSLPMIKKMGHSINTLRGAVVTDRPTRNFVVMS